MTEEVLLLDQLVKRFDANTVLKGVSTEVFRGDVIGLLGLNGAGKTTLLETALGFCVPDGGSVRLFGQRSNAIQDETIKHRIGFVPQQDELIEQMKGREFLGLVSKFYANWNNELIDRLFRPMFRPDPKIEGDGLSLFEESGLQPWAVMAFNNLVMSYVTMAPMYRDLLGQDPFSEEALENQLNLIKTLLRAVFEYRG